jgi:hypothetical protein
MRTEQQVIVHIEELRALRNRLVVYLDDVVRARDDWHGVMDAAADIREVEAELAALRWVLE